MGVGLWYYTEPNQAGLVRPVAKICFMLRPLYALCDKSLRSLCKHSTMAQKVLPHNVAWPFLPFLPSWCGPLSAAILCGRKRLMAPKMALMLKQRVLPDNVAPPIFSQIFLGADKKICGQHVIGRSRHTMRQK